MLVLACSPLAQYDPSGGRIIPTSDFGPRGGGMHRGIDLGADDGLDLNTDVHSVLRGVAAEGYESGGAGNWVNIDHGFIQGVGNVVTKYFHNNSFIVKPGDVVEAGQHISEAGTTGASTGTHVHFEVWINGVPVNPRVYLEAAWAAGRYPGVVVAPIDEESDEMSAEDVKSIQDKLDTLIERQGRFEDDTRKVVVSLLDAVVEGQLQHFFDRVFRQLDPTFGAPLDGKREDTLRAVVEADFNVSQAAEAAVVPLALKVEELEGKVVDLVAASKAEASASEPSEQAAA